MKTKKVLVGFGVLVLGSVITVAIDNLIGISFKDITAVTQITHKVTHTLWGAILLLTIQRLNNQPSNKEEI